MNQKNKDYIDLTSEFIKITILLCILGVLLGVSSYLSDFKASEIDPLVIESKRIISLINQLPVDKLYYIDDLMNRCDEIDCVNRLIQWLMNQTFEYKMGGI